MTALTTMQKRDAALAIACPACLVPPGQWCHAGFDGLCYVRRNTALDADGHPKAGTK